MRPFILYSSFKMVVPANARDAYLPAAPSTQ
jgi:hypothetical protein